MRKKTALIFTGIAAGILSGIVKFGWEVPFPPRTPVRDANNPPQILLEKLGFSFQQAHLSYTYNSNSRPIMSFIVHFGFSIFFALLYTFLVEKWAIIKVWGGAAFGIVVFVLFHEIIMPIMGVVPAPWNQPWQEHLSEFFGHIVWFWTIEIVRRDLRNRLTHESDPT
ncbi:YagU family protein [Rhizosphaericola mali]|uniref:YagU family protein n=1 Tax=Rhizosphaericola mali TaxID=2545455 RepID=UPI001CD9E96D|nr:DUF1440 domain-containing protein [Rhizosphaericola mali]